LIQYFRAGVHASASIAEKDLTITVTPNSEKDELGVAFAKMLNGLQQMIGQVAENAKSVSSAALQLADASRQSGQATGQIALTIQQVASGTAQQSQEAANTFRFVERMNRAIQDVAGGAQEQANLVDEASAVVARISTAVQQVMTNAQTGAAGASEAAEVAVSGSATIEAAISGMQSLKSKVALSAEKVREMGQRSEQIGAIVETIDEIASQTNMLALNAAIEAARVEAKGEKTVETLLQQHMLGAAHLVAHMLAAGTPLGSRELEALARQAQLEDFFISDSEGVIVAASNPGSLGFRFSEDPQQQSSVFRPLLNQQDGEVIQPLQRRDQDGKPYVYVGVSRRDQPGIVQAGISGEAIVRLLGYSRGFAVVATEIRRLADHAKGATKEVAALIHSIQKTVAQAVVVMEDGVRDVENRSAQANEASQSLFTIRQTVESVSRQVEEIAATVGSMDASSKELVRAMEAVDAVVEENTATTKEMTIHAREMTQAIENIASVSEENGAAVEQVSASTEEVSAQVEQVAASATALMGMARNLQQLVSQFKLKQASVGARELNKQTSQIEILQRA
jgi:methyl-accepting chemotaxis protein